MTIYAISTHLSCIQYLLYSISTSTSPLLWGLVERESGSPGGREETTFIGSLPCGGFPLPAMWAPLPVTCALLPATCDPLLAMGAPLQAMCAPLPVTCAPPLATWTRPDTTVSRVFLFHEDQIEVWKIQKTWGSGDCSRIKVLTM